MRQLAHAVSHAFLVAFCEDGSLYIWETNRMILVGTILGGVRNLEEKRYSPNLPHILIVSPSQPQAFFAKYSGKDIHGVDLVR